MQTGQAASPMWLVLNIKIYLNDEKCLLPSALGAGDPHSYAFPSHSCDGFYGRIKAAALVSPRQQYIVQHTRPSCCLMVSQLSITFACHAFCFSLSKYLVNGSEQDSRPVYLH